MDYVAAVRAIPMGEQPIVIDGREASRYDVLSKKPDLETNFGVRSIALTIWKVTCPHCTTGLREGQYPSCSDCSATRSDS